MTISNSGWYIKAKINHIEKQALNMNDLKRYVQLGGAAAMLGLSPINTTDAWGQTAGKATQQSLSNGSPSNAELEEFIGNWEGVRAKAYKDSRGIWTIGIGFNLERSDASEILQNMGINKKSLISGKTTLTKEQISKLFANNLETAKSDALEWIPNLAEHPKEIQMIIIDFAFNLGANKLNKFPKAQAAFKKGDYKTAAAELKNSAWYGQVGRRSKHHVATVAKYAQ